jgi:hypothetical protein
MVADRLCAALLADAAANAPKPAAPVLRYLAKMDHTAAI